tara:strand:- start:110 stop:583 length:474 start_codon:yes stop_codon:yes gene_type:complete
MRYKSKEKKIKDMERGRVAEQAYARTYTSVSWPTNEQDYKEHWDVMINYHDYLEPDTKVDVKAIKKNNENIHFIELKNVMGEKGWLYGDADMFAFETNKYWVEVTKERLQNFIAMVCKDKVYGRELYQLGSRPNAEDLFTTVSTLDLCRIGSMRDKV